jgi:hypothetical protein
MATGLGSPNAIGLAADLCQLKQPSGAFDLGMGTLASPPVAAGGGLTQRQIVFWKGTNGNLFEAYTGTGDLALWNGPKNLGDGPLGSTPCVIDANSVAYVFWKGTNGKLWEISGPDDGGPFGTPVDLGIGPMKTTPGCAEDDATQRQVVYWEGTNGELTEAYGSPGGGWQGPINLGDGPLASAPCVIDADSTSFVFWRGTNGELWQAYGPDTGPGGGAPLPNKADLGRGPVNSAPTCAGGGGAQRQVVYWKGANGDLVEAYWNPGQWKGPDYVDINGLKDAPAVIDANGTAFVFYDGPNNNLWEAYGPDGGGPL